MEGTNRFIHIHTASTRNNPTYKGILLMSVEKRIVAHHSPDIDALAAIWLIHRYKPRWKDAEVCFVSSGKTLNDMPVDSDPNIIHVDTGMGMFDHHHTSLFTSAARLVFDALIEEHLVPQSDIEAVERMVDVVTRYDHFHEVLLADANDDMHIFSLSYIIYGLRLDPLRVQELVNLAELSLDGILQFMKSKAHAEHIIEKGHTESTAWGKTLYLDTDNDRAVKVAFMMGYDMVVRFSPHYGNVAIRLHPSNKHILKNLYKKFTASDPGAQWFYHASGRMLLNASTRDTKHLVTKFSPTEIRNFIEESVL